VLERVYQMQLIRRLKHEFPGLVVLKNDPNYIQGFPDLTLLHFDRWGVLETKPSLDAPFQPNQEYYLDLLNGMSFGRVIAPENEVEIVHELYQSFSAPR